MGCKCTVPLGLVGVLFSPYFTLVFIGLHSVVRSSGKKNLRVHEIDLFISIQFFFSFRTVRFNSTNSTLLLDGCSENAAVRTFSYTLYGIQQYDGGLEFIN